MVVLHCIVLNSSKTITRIHVHNYNVVLTVTHATHTLTDMGGYQEWCCSGQSLRSHELLSSHIFCKLAHHRSSQILLQQPGSASVTIIEVNISAVVQYNYWCL